MKKFGAKILSLVLVAALLCCSPLSISAVGASSAVDENISRVSVTFFDDSKTTRGFNWCTKESTGTDVQVVGSLNYLFSGFDNATTYSGTESKFKDYYYHKAVATALEAGSSYYYRVGSAATGLWSDVGSFHTDAGKDSAFSFISIADVQASSLESFTKSSKVLDKAFQENPFADFVTNSGDFVNDCTNEEWEWFFSTFKDSLTKTTSAPVAGNHDGNLKWNWFKNQFNLKAADGSDETTGVYYSFDYGNAHFAVLNTNDMYPMSNQQINWLKNDMNKSDADWKFVLLHRALYSAGKNINKPDTVVQRNRLLPIIDELDIDVVIAGHDHMYFRTQQVKNDKVQETQYINEYFQGKMYEFALNPEGTVHILPNTAGTKRYGVNKKAMSPIFDCAAVATQPGMPVYTTFSIDGEKLVYKAFTVNVDGENEVEQIDQYAIKKTTKGSATEGYEDADTTILGNLLKNLVDVVKAIVYLPGKYISMLPSLFK